MCVVGMNKNVLFFWSGLGDVKIGYCRQSGGKFH